MYLKIPCPMKFTKPHCSFIWAFLIALAGLSTWHYWGYPNFGTNDDTLMLLLLSGAYSGTPEPGVFFMHPLLSELLATFYRYFPNSNAYALHYLLAQTLVLATCSAIFWEKHKEWGKGYTFLFLLTLWSLSSLFAVRLQFTTTAFMLVGTGALLLYRQLEQPHKHRPFALIAFLLWGYLLRDQVFLPSMALLSPFFLKYWKKKALWVWLGVILLAILLSQGLHHWYYHQDEAWSKYANYRQIHPQLKFTDNPEATQINTLKLETSALAPESIPLLIHKDIATVDAQLAQIKVWAAAKPSKWEALDTNAPLRIARLAYFQYWALLGLLLLYLLLPQRDWYSVFALLAFSALFTYLTLFLVAKYRVVWGLLWTLLLLVWYNQKYPKTIWKKLGLIAILALFSYKYARSFQNEYKSAKQGRKEWLARWSCLSEDYVYIGLVGRLDLNRVNPWHIAEMHRAKRLLFTATMSGSPIVLKQLEQYLDYRCSTLVPPLFKEVLPRYHKQMRVLGSPPELLQQYLRRQGGQLIKEGDPPCERWRWEAGQ